MIHDGLILEETITHKWLCDELSDYLSNLPGGLEYNQIIFMLQNSIRAKLSGDFVTAVATTIRDRLSTIEDVLDTITLKEQPLWLEYEHLTRTKVFGKPETNNTSDTVTVGSLVMCNPNNSQQITIFNAWKTRAGDIYHSFALLQWDLDAFRDKKINIEEQDINLRLMELGSAGIPGNLLDTMVILNSLSRRPDLVKKAKTQTIQDVLGEHIFLIGCVEMLSSSSIVMVPLDIDSEEQEQDNFAQHWEVRMEQPFDLLARFRKGGFRKGLGGQVAWSPMPPD